MRKALVVALAREPAKLECPAGIPLASIARMTRGVSKGAQTFKKRGLIEKMLVKSP